MFKLKGHHRSTKSWTAKFNLTASGLILTSSIFIASIFFNADKSLAAYAYKICETYPTLEQYADIGNSSFSVNPSSKIITITNSEGKTKSFDYQSKGKKLCFINMDALKFLYGID